TIEKMPISMPSNIQPKRAAVRASHLAEPAASLEWVSDTSSTSTGQAGSCQHSHLRGRLKTHSLPEVDKLAGKWRSPSSSPPLRSGRASLLLVTVCARVM